MKVKNNIINRKPVVSLKTLAKNVSHLMVKAGIDSQSLSDGTGVGIATINNLKRGTGNPTIATLTAVADFFNVSAGSLMDSDMTGTGRSSAADENVKVLPLTNFNDLELFMNQKPVKKRTYVSEVENPADDTLFAVEITTTSLFPEIERGAICIVSQSEKYCDGDIVLLKIRASHLCFRRLFIADTGYKFSNITLDKNLSIIDYDNYHIVGVVIKKINNMK